VAARVIAQPPVFDASLDWGTDIVMRGGLTVGGVIVIIGIVLAIFWSVLWGIIIALIGLLAFGGFARGRWY
jgi:hypothetical protein